MTIQIKKNPQWTKEQHEAFAERLKANDGYCPCMLQKTPDTKCMCKQFKNMIDRGEFGECHCGRYVFMTEDADD